MKNFTKEQIKKLYEEVLYELSLDPIDGGFAEMSPESYDDEILRLEFYRGYQILRQLRDCDGAQYAIKTSICEGLEFNTFDRPIVFPENMKPEDFIDFLTEGINACELPILSEQDYLKEKIKLTTGSAPLEQRVAEFDSFFATPYQNIRKTRTDAKIILKDFEYLNRLRERREASDKEAAGQKELKKHGKNRELLPTYEQLQKVDALLAGKGLAMSQMSAKRKAAFRNSCYTVFKNGEINLTQYYCLVNSFAPMPGRADEPLTEKISGLVNSTDFKNIF